LKILFSPKKLRKTLSVQARVSYGTSVTSRQLLNMDVSGTTLSGFPSIQAQSAG
jgi:hypothetical protein